MNRSHILASVRLLVAIIERVVGKETIDRLCDIGKVTSSL